MFTYLYPKLLDRDWIILSFEAELPGRRVVPEVFQMIYTRYYSLIKYIRDQDVLEVGCGAGLGLGFINRYAKHIIGGDYSSLNIEIAKKHYRNRIEILMLDAHELPFSSYSFDIIVAMELLLYLNVPKFLSGCRKVLRENGMIIACIPNKNRKGFSPSKLSRNYFSIPELFKLFQDQNFKPEIFGAFKIRLGTSDEKAWNESKKNRVIGSIGRIMRAIPGGIYVKNYLGKKIFKKIMLPNELEPNMIKSGDLVRLNPMEENDEYKILYVFAVKNT